MQNLPGLDDLDPAAAFLAREQEQLGELEEEIGSLSGARFFCFFRISYFGHCQHLDHCHHHHDHHDPVSMEATVGSRTSSRGAGIELKKVKEVSFHNCFCYC